MLQSKMVYNKPLTLLIALLILYFFDSSLELIRESILE